MEDEEFTLVLGNLVSYSFKKYKSKSVRVWIEEATQWCDLRTINMIFIHGKKQT
jgi:hypothetical protein